jgi:hypothetical protein
MTVTLPLNKESCAIFHHCEEKPRIIIHQCDDSSIPDNVRILNKHQIYDTSSSKHITSETYLVFTHGIIYAHSRTDQQLMDLFELSKNYQLGKPIRIYHKREYGVMEGGPSAVDLGENKEEFRTSIEAKLKELGLWQPDITYCIEDPEERWAQPRWSMHINLGVLTTMTWERWVEV